MCAVRRPPPSDRPLTTLQRVLSKAGIGSRTEARAWITARRLRVNGRVVWVKVTPRHGVPYYLIPDPNGQQFIRRNSLDISVRVPLWVLLSW